MPGLPQPPPAATPSVPPADRPSAPPAPPAWAVSWPVRVAVEWAWRVALLGAVLYLAVRALDAVRMVWVALAVAVLLAALLRAPVTALQRRGLPAAAAAAVVFLAGLALLGGAGWFVTARFTSSLDDIGASLQAGVGQVQDWLADGPLGLSSAQIEDVVRQVTDRLQQGNLASGAVSTAATAAQLATGALLALFLTFFFLIDGQRIWAWLFGRFPQSAQAPVDRAGRDALVTLTGYVRGTILVALADGVSLGMALVLLGVPLAVPIAVLVFLGAFVPLVGATVTGAVAVLVALVSNGLITALLVLAAVFLVQQVEGSLLQPFILSRAVQLHPVAIVLAVTVGGLLAGIAGAVVAVPLAAVVNTAAGTLTSSRTGAPQPGQQTPDPDDHE